MIWYPTFVEEERTAFRASPTPVCIQGASEKGREKPPFAARGKFPEISVEADWNLREIAVAATATTAWTRIRKPGTAAINRPEAETEIPIGVVGIIFRPVKPS
jgi:hypothetical protein